MQDLSPKLTGIQPAASELYTPPLDVPIGQLIGGIAAFGNSLIRGSGNEIFGSDPNGIWLGGPDWADGPFRVDMHGNATLASATFKDALGQTVIDSNGINSTNQFKNDFYSDDTIITITAGGFTDVAGSELSFTLTRDANILISFFAEIFTYINLASTQYTTTVAITIDGVEQSPYASDTWYQALIRTLVKGSTVSCARIFSLTAGDHTIKLRWLTNSNNQADMGSRNLSYVLLGK